MPEENQKLWTKLVKRQRRTTWAVLGVALVAVLLAVWWVPTLTSGPQIALSPDEDGDDPGEESRDPLIFGPRLTIRHVTTETAIKAMMDFTISVTCDRNFQVKSVFADVDSPDHLDVDIKYTQVEAKGDFAGTGIVYWRIVSQLHDPMSGAESLRGYELLSQMQVDHPVGIPAGGLFIIDGEVESSSDALISVGALIETSRGAHCSVVVNP